MESCRVFVDLVHSILKIHKSYFLDNFVTEYYDRDSSWKTVFRNLLFASKPRNIAQQ